MITLTQEHQAAYQTVLAVIAKKAEKKWKWKWKFWSISSFLALVYLFFTLSKVPLDSDFLIMIVVIVILPLGHYRGMTMSNYKRAILAEIKKQSDGLNFIERQRDLKEADAKLHSVAWSYTIEADRKKWGEMQPKFDATIANLKTWGEKLDMALEYYNQHQNAVNT